MSSLPIRCRGGAAASQAGTGIGPEARLPTGAGHACRAPPNGAQIARPGRLVRVARGRAMTTAFKIIAFQSIRAGALVGFADVHLPSGMVLHRCSIFARDDKAWASPPSKQVIGRDG